MIYNKNILKDIEAKIYKMNLLIMMLLFAHHNNFKYMIYKNIIFKEYFLMRYKRLFINI